MQSYEHGASPSGYPLKPILQQKGPNGEGQCDHPGWNIYSCLGKHLTFTGGADDAFSRLQLKLKGAFAEFERNIIRKQQAEGIAKAKVRGV
jgi:hypothetical protein